MKKVRKVKSFNKEVFLIFLENCDIIRTIHNILTMIVPPNRIPIRENESILDAAYSEIGETYTGIKDNVTEKLFYLIGQKPIKLSNYLVACWEAIAPQQKTKDVLSSDIPLSQDSEISPDSDITTIWNPETITLEKKKWKGKQKKKWKKKGKKKKK